LCDWAFDYLIDQSLFQITHHFDKSKLVKMLKEPSHSNCHKGKIAQFPQQKLDFS